VAPPPAKPSIYHITHVENLPQILADGELYSDAKMIEQGRPNAKIGMSKVKQRRLGLPVGCHPGTTVGQYVPFYFCPRSVMLYVIYCANNPDLAYRGGQAPIIHLECDLHAVISWAINNHRPWAYSLSNAGAAYTKFDSTVSGLDQVNWDSVQNNDFRDPDVQEHKQAEFLVHERFPWSLVTRVGVRTRGTKQAVDRALASFAHRPSVQVITEWYF
jgi:hypothetical protein